MKTIVKNVISNKSMLFVNDISLTENIVSYIILEIKNSASNLLNPELREKIKNEADIKESVSTITGQSFAHSQTFDLYAKHEN